MRTGASPRLFPEPGTVLLQSVVYKSLTSIMVHNAFLIRLNASSQILRALRARGQWISKVLDFPSRSKFLGQSTVDLPDIYEEMVEDDELFSQALATLSSDEVAEMSRHTSITSNPTRDFLVANLLDVHRRMAAASRRDHRR